MVSKQFVEFPVAQSVDLTGLESYPIPHDSDWFRNGHVTKEIFLEATEEVLSHS